MSNKNIAPEGLELEISKIISEYTEEVSKGIEEEIDSTAEKVLEEIKTTAPKKTGEYANGFKIKKEAGQGEEVRTIYNADKPGLTHLLEIGHGKRGGGRIEGRPHMRPAYEKFVPQMEQNIENIIKNGGK